MFSGECSCVLKYDVQSTQTCTVVAAVVGAVDTVQGSIVEKIKHIAARIARCAGQLGVLALARRERLARQQAAAILCAAVVECVQDGRQ